MLVKEIENELQEVLKRILEEKQDSSAFILGSGQKLGENKITHIYKSDSDFQVIIYDKLNYEINYRGVKVNMSHQSDKTIKLIEEIKSQIINI